MIFDTLTEPPLSALRFVHITQISFRAPSEAASDASAVHPFSYRILLTGYTDDDRQNVSIMVGKTRSRAGIATALGTVQRRLADALEQQILHGGA